MLPWTLFGKVTCDRSDIKLPNKKLTNIEFIVICTLYFFTGSDSILASNQFTATSALYLKEFGSIASTKVTKQAYCVLFSLPLPVCS